MPKSLSSSLRIAAIPLLLGGVLFLELEHPFHSFRPLSFILVFVLFADLASLMRGKPRDYMLILASLALGVGLLEAAAAFMEPKSSTEATQGWSVARPILGWGPEHAGRFQSRKWDPKTGADIYNASYSIDANLLRKTRSCDAGQAIAFFGCSFTFGDGLNDDETLPQALADLLGPKQRVLNFAFSGYGPQQFLREMETGMFDAVIGPRPSLFIFLTAAWHAERTSCKAYWTAHAPLYALENDQITFKGACNEGASLWLREWLENSPLYRLAIEPYRHRLGHDDIDLYIRVVLAAVKLAREKYGASTLIPFIALSDDYLKRSGFSNEAIIQRLQDGGAFVVDASLKKEEAEGAVISIVGDGHPTPFANRARAAMLKTYVEQRMPGVLASSMTVEASSCSTTR